MLRIKRVGDYAYEIEGEVRDYHVCLNDSRNAPDDDNPWYVDVFDTGIGRAGQAHICTETFPQLEKALEYVFSEESAAEGVQG